MKMEEYKAALLAFKLVTDQYYDTDYIDQTHLKIIEIYIHRGEFEEARNHFESKRKNIENLNMADLVNAWFDQGRVFDRIEMK
jgi:lipopolysaccharide biosynthesis regulator YciM